MAHHRGHTRVPGTVRMQTQGGKMLVRGFTVASEGKVKVKQGLQA